MIRYADLVNSPSEEDLISALAWPSPYVRREAARGLGELGSGSAVEALIATLADPDPLVRLTVVWALAELGDPRAATALEAASVAPHNQLLLDLAVRARQAARMLRGLMHPVESEVALPLAVKVAEVCVVVGQTVAAGQVLFRFVPVPGDDDSDGAVKAPHAGEVLEVDLTVGEELPVMQVAVRLRGYL